jgi:hypothetical protein
VGPYGGFRIIDITNPSAPRVIENECSTSRFRIATATGRMRVNPVGEGESKVFTGNFRIRIFRDTIQVGDGCPQPGEPPPCPDLWFDFPSDSGAANLTGTFDVSSGRLNLATGLVESGDVFIARILQHRSTTEGNFGFDPNSGTWFLDPPPGPSFGGSMSGPMNDPFRVTHPCGGEYDRYPVSVTDTPSFNTRFDFVPESSQHAWSQVYDSLGRYIFAGITLDF